MELLLDRTFAFTEADVLKNVLIPFRLERDYDRLVIHLHYSPKEIRDPEIIMPQIQNAWRPTSPPAISSLRRTWRNIGLC